MTRRIRTGSQLEQLAAYSRAVEHNGWVFVSGTMGTDPTSGQLPPSLGAQADNAFATIRRALEQLGVRFSDIVHCRVFLSERALVPELIPVLKKEFEGIEPANTTVIALLPHPDAKIEIEVIALAGAGSDTAHMS